jgi:hypothetical protein
MNNFACWQYKRDGGRRRSFPSGIVQEKDESERTILTLAVVTGIPKEIARDEVVRKLRRELGLAFDEPDSGFDAEWPDDVRHTFENGLVDKLTWASLWPPA